MTSSAQSRSVSIPQLRSAFGDRLIAPGDPEYDAARTPFYGGIDRRPVAIIRARDANDASRVVTIARESGLELAIRSGGHSIAGHGVSDGGIVLDLSQMRAMAIDREQRTAWVEPGLTAGAYAASAKEAGLATGFGDVGSVGIGGLVLGGGVGLLSRKYGLTIDDLLAAEIVIASGERLAVDAGSHPDLFWAIRGGGGNFGVVTRLRLRLHDLPSVVGGTLMLPATAETVERFVAEAAAAPDELSAIVNVMPAPPMPNVPAEHHGQLIIFALICFAGDAEAGQRAMAPFRALAAPIVDDVKVTSYADIFVPEPPGYHPIAAARTMFIDAVDRRLAARVLDRLKAATAPMAVAQFRVLGGAISRVPNDATAYAHRHRRIMVNAAAIYERVEDAGAQEQWLSGLISTLDPPDNAAYVNFLGAEGADRVRDAYPPTTWQRLQTIKQRYDPGNLFRLNQNVPPAG